MCMNSSSKEATRSSKLRLRQKRICGMKQWSLGNRMQAADDDDVAVDSLGIDLHAACRKGTLTQIQIPIKTNRP